MVAHPAIPAEAQRRGITGQVDVAVSLDATGAVVAENIKSTDSPVLNEASLSAARHSTYAPAIANCVAVAGTYDFIVLYSNH
jgi:TonB family protein